MSTALRLRAFLPSLADITSAVIAGDSVLLLFFDLFLVSRGPLLCPRRRRWSLRGSVSPCCASCWFLWLFLRKAVKSWVEWGRAALGVRMLGTNVTLFKGRKDFEH